MDIKESVKKMTETAGAAMRQITKREVNFSCHKPDAKKVYLAGDFNNWDVTTLAMKSDRNGTWSKTLKLAPGQYQYGFVADGSWVKDLSCAEMVSNPFGSYNCVMKVK